MGALPEGIAGEIAAAGGRVTFARFMELALTHPTEGYYTTTRILLGPRGDFTTAPALSPEFCDSVARLVEELILGMDSAGVGPPAGRVGFIELGGGHGELLGAVLLRLQRGQPALKGRMTFTVVEVGRELRARQRRALARRLREGWCVDWVSSLTEALEKPRGVAVVVGNEFFDALPVHVVDVRGDALKEAWVEVGDGGRERGARLVTEVWGPVVASVEGELEALFGTTSASELRAQTREGVLEVRPEAGRMFEALAAGTRACCLVTIDYGAWFGAGEPYRRTLRGYFRHHRVEDLLGRAGRQDITADVDFRALDVHGRRAGFETVLYTTVAGALLGDGGEQRLARLSLRSGGSLDADRRAAVLEALLDPESVGGAYKVMLQVRE